MTSLLDVILVSTCFHFSFQNPPKASFGGVLGASWAVLEASWDVLGASWKHLESFTKEVVSNMCLRLSKLVDAMDDTSM